MVYQAVLDSKGIYLDENLKSIAINEANWVATPEGLDVNWAVHNSIYDFIFDNNFKINKDKLMTIDEKKSGKYDDLERAYRIELNKGYFDASENITIAINETDRLAFTSQLAFFNLATELGQTLDVQEITDIDGIPKLLEAQNIKILLLKMGVYYKELRSNKVTIVNAIKNAINETELSAINLSL